MSTEDDKERIVVGNSTPQRVYSVDTLDTSDGAITFRCPEALSVENYVLLERWLPILLEKSANGVSEEEVRKYKNDNLQSEVVLELQRRETTLILNRLRGEVG